MPVREACYSYGISQLCQAAVHQGGRGKPQPWRAVEAAVRAMERLIACYGIPEQVQPRDRYPMVIACYGIPEQAQPHMAGSSPIASLRARASSAARRPQWHESGGVSAREG
jgi:hypothetical protein